MHRDLRLKIQWCPLRSTCPRWDSSEERCTCAFVERLWERHPDLASKLWKEVVSEAEARRSSTAQQSQP